MGQIAKRVEDKRLLKLIRVRRLAVILAVCHWSAQDAREQIFKLYHYPPP